MKILQSLFVLFYVFMIPVYYYHFKEYRSDRGNDWNDEEHNTCVAASFIWPLVATMECVVEYQDYQIYKDKIRKDRQKARER